jgi:hypothetical protein
MTMATPIDLTHISSTNTGLATKVVEVAGGFKFVVLDLSVAARNKSRNIVYLHVNKINKRCYIGITIMTARMRWARGVAYRQQRRFGAAIRTYGWDAYDSYILAFAEDRKDLSRAECEAIKAIGGHKSKHNYNLTPGGDFVADNGVPVVAVNLRTKETINFESGSEAARALGIPDSDSVTAVTRGENRSCGDWWFRLADDKKSKPPEVWGKALRTSKVRDHFGKKVIAIHFQTKETRIFDTVSDAAIALDVQPSAISQVARGVNFSAGEWWFKYEDNDQDMPAIYGSELTRLKRDVAVYAFNLTTKQRLEFRNNLAAETALNLYVGAVSGVIMGGRTSAGDWWFSNDKDATPPTVFKSALVALARSKAVIATCVETGLKSEYASALDAGKALGMSRAAISKSIKAQGKPVKGYSFQFL